MTSKVSRLEDWPEADRVAWAAALAEGDIFDGQGPAVHWSETTRRVVAWNYGRWIGYLMSTEPQALRLGPAARLTRERLRSYLDCLASQITPASVFIYTSKLYHAIRVMAPEQDWDWLKAIVWCLEGRGQSRRGKAARMVTVGQLIELGQALMDSADDETDPVKGAIAYRDGLVITLLASRPIRRRNLAMIELDRHLVQAGSRWHLIFSADETKNRQPYEMVLPEFLEPHVERFLTAFRPRFPGADTHKGAWASAKGCPMTAEGLYERVCKRTEAAFGKAVNPHLFRDIAATEIAYRAPEHIGIARDLLGHSDLRSVDRHYNQARQIEAGRAYQATLFADRAELTRDRRRLIERS